MLLLLQALQKDSEFKGFRPSITAILSSAACIHLDIFHLSRSTLWAIGSCSRIGVRISKHRHHEPNDFPLAKNLPIALPLLRILLPLKQGRILP